MMRKIYLAGPDVFRRDAKALGQAKADICAEFGFEGLFPLDSNVDLTGLSPFQSGVAIYNADIDLMNRCDLIVANMTPFRGPGIDGGTAFEMGYMRAQGKPVWGYTLDTRDYGDRVEHAEPGWDHDDQHIEAFGMSDNLMMVGAIAESGGSLLRVEGDPKRMEDHLRAFRAVIEALSSL
ncbi:Nucleoside 2-deoxyribosyltransferase [Marinobacterium lacunae]|uniref:Nucleoside 2-deoxyribosyltransferase n=1 Tax=Marinobacterium lacunae TaxID=1232683 RepID=A0A081FTH0_9GAMM|nr:nucleoside 2-deoxyribosyltransferase [Marinobacterium lacunae]KEA61825.1 Nucleoside 2-deoxyribosyltransferase [Marinobacterium lacunae]